MSVETIFRIALYPFVQESIASLRDMTSLRGHAGMPVMDKVEDFVFNGYAVCTRINGSLDGAIIMHHHLDTAVAVGNDVAHSMLGDMHEHTEVDEELGKALAEWGNTIVGRATDFLGKHHLGFEFSAPVFTTSLDDLNAFFAGVQHVVTVPITIDGVGQYYFHLLVRTGSYEALELARHQIGSEALSEPVSADRVVAIPNPDPYPLPYERRILLVDDSALIRRAVHRFLNELGYGNIVEAEDGREAVTAVEEGDIDFVIMDVVMENMNGDEALRQMRVLDPDIPVVMLSSVTDEKVVDRFRKLDISAFIFKPLSSDQGPQVLSQCLKI
ncbi:MAG: response regulator [Marinobacterium sp.]|nr:response regulator [Marinobacterium sp.]